MKKASDKTVQPSMIKILHKLQQSAYLMIKSWKRQGCLPSPLPWVTVLKFLAHVIRWEKEWEGKYKVNLEQLVTLESIEGLKE